MWKSNEIEKATTDSIRALIANEIPAVRVEGFATPEETAAFGNAMLASARRTSSIQQVTRLGISQYQQGVKGSKAEYFSAAEEARSEYEHVFADSFNPLARFIAALTAMGFDAGVMEESGYGPYFAGSGKLRNGFSPIHVDFSPQDSPGWAVGDLSAQLAWNYYVQVPPTGGELLLWDRQWQPEHDIHMADGQYYYQPTVVDGAEQFSFAVPPGEVVLLNSRNFHAVAESVDRLAYGSFIACTKDGRLGLFS